MAHDSRLGLATTPSAASITPGYLDAQQWVKAIAAAKTTLSNMLGGEGIYSGGATVVGDLPTAGTQYPATTLIVYDDSGYAWPFVVAAAKDISFTDTSGAGALYAVIKQLNGVSPAAAVGGLADVEFVAQLAATAAPANSLKLGTGTITASAFTTWSEEATARVAAGDGLFARLNLAEVVTGLWRFGVNTLRLGDGTDATITLLAHNADGNKPGLRYNHTANAWESSNDGTTWVALVQSTDSRLTDARTPTAHASTHATAGSDPISPAALSLGTVRGSYTRTTNQALTTNVDTPVEWQSRDDFAGLGWTSGTNPDRITVGAGESGQYLVVALAGFGADGSGDRRAAITVNGSRMIWTILPPPTTGAAALLSLTWQGPLAEGDILRLEVTQNSGGNLDFLCQYSSFRVFRLWG